MVAGAGIFAPPAHPYHLPQGCEQVVTAKSARPFIDKVWDASWRRGSPGLNVRKAWRHKLHCAGPENRVAMKQRWKAGKRAYFRNRQHVRYCRGGPVFSGLVSTFGPPGEGAGTTATGVSSGEPGIAIYNPATLGATFRVTIGGHSATLTQTDIGPAPWTGRTIDVTGAGADLLGGVVTDSYGTARLLPAGCA